MGAIVRDEIWTSLSMLKPALTDEDLGFIAFLHDTKRYEEAAEYIERRTDEWLQGRGIFDDRE